jgi:hypothetical protein
MGDETQALAVDPEDGGVDGLTEPRGALHHGVQHWLNVRRRLANHAEDLARRRLLFQRLRQPLLQVPDPGAIALRRLAGKRSLRVRLTLRTLCAAIHQGAPASLGTAFDDRLGEGRRLSKRGQRGCR